MKALNSNSALWTLDGSFGGGCCWNICPTAKAIELPRPGERTHQAAEPTPKISEIPSFLLATASVSMTGAAAEV